MIHFITQHYNPFNAAKARHLLDTLHFNLSLGIFDSVTLLVEAEINLSTFPTIKMIDIGHRAMFSDFLDCISQMADESSHVVFANSDMMMSHDIPIAAEKLTKDNSAIALTRRELNGKLPSIDNPSSSQDTWIMKSHHISSMLKDTVRHSLGIAGCENIFAAQLIANGYNLWNPSLDVTTLHNDPSPCLTYPRDHRYNGFYAFPTICQLIDVEDTIPDYEFTFCVKR